MIPELGHFALILALLLLVLRIRPLRPARDRLRVPFGVTPEGIPVLGGAGVINVPFGLFMGFEI